MVAYIDSDTPDSGTDTYFLTVGRNSSGAYFRTLIDFGVANYVPVGATVIDATLRVYKTYVGGPPTLRFAWITGSWSESTITWNNQPESTYYTARSFIPTVSTGYQNFDVTNEVQRMVDYRLNNGFMLFSADNVVDELLQFYSSDSTNDPQLRIEYIP